MAVEIETKLKVDSLAPVREALNRITAEFIANHVQTDLYCDNGEEDMVKQDKCLRVRIETTGQQARTLVTFKGPRQAADIKCRLEIEWPVPDADQATTLLEGLGYTQKLAVHKQREQWSYRQCQIALDEVTGLGPFVEIEGPDSDVIRDVQKDLGLGHVPHCHESYACLLSQKSSVQSPES
jgi:predicted adenylyl cyclase CyaB